MEPPTTRHLSTHRGSSRWPSSHVALAAGLPPPRLRLERGLRAPGCARRPADAAIRADYATKKGALCRRLRHARRAREPARPALAADRAAGDADPARALANPREPVFRLEGGPGLTNMDFPRREPLRRRPRRRARRLPRRRRLLGARLPRGRVGDEAGPQPARERPTTTRTRSGLSDCAKRLRGRGRRPRRLLAARARRRSRGRAPRPRLPPDRPAQRERGHPHGPDLRLALPEEHPPLGDDRRQPARATSSGTRGSTDEQVGKYAALCATDDACSARTNDLAATIQPTRRGRSRTAGASCAIKPGNVADRRLLRADSTRLSVACRSPAPHDDRHVAVRRQGRRERTAGSCR